MKNQQLTESHYSSKLFVFNKSYFNCVTPTYINSSSWCEKVHLVAYNHKESQVSTPFSLLDTNSRWIKGIKWLLI